MRKGAFALALAGALVGSAALGQPSVTRPIDPLRFSHLRDFAA